jgi:hypothetical protein
VRRGRRNDRAHDIFVEVRATNAAVERFDQNFVVELDAGVLYLFNTDVFFTVIACGFHARPFCF